MIEAINLQNIQSFENASIKLGKVTVITGLSHSGKSALVRGVVAMLKNSFVNSLLRHGAKRCQVSVVTESEEVGFVKGAESHYFVGEDVLSKTGKEIPGRVVDILKMRKIQFDKDNEFFLNVQSQMDPQFLVSDYGGLASKVIGRLSNLCIVYVARRRAFSKQKALKGRAETAEFERGTLVGKLEKVKRASFIFEEESLKKQIEKRNLLLAEMERLSRIAELFKAVSDFNSFSDKIKKLFIFIQEIERFLYSFEDKVSRCQIICEALQAILFSPPDLKLSIVNIDKAFLDLDLFSSSILKVEAIIAYNNAYYEEMKLKVECKGIENEVNALLKELESELEKKKVCPTCFTPLTKEAKSRIVDGL